VVVVGKNVIQPRFVRDDVANARPILERPLHVGDESGHRKFLAAALLENLLDQCEHRILVEDPFAEVGLLPAAYFKLLGVLSALRVDSRGRQSLNVAGALGWIDDMNRAVARGKAFTDEWKENLVKLFFVVKERTRMTAAA